MNGKWAAAAVATCHLELWETDQNIVRQVICGAPVVFYESAKVVLFKMVENYLLQLRRSQNKFAARDDLEEVALRN